MSDQDQNTGTTLVQIPFGGGLAQKEAQEWIDPTQNLGAIVNGQWTKANVVSKRAGMRYVTTYLGATPGNAGKVISWSRQPIGAAIAYESGSAFLWGYNLAQGEQTSFQALPSPRTTKNALSSVPNASTQSETTTSALTPVIVDCSQLGVRLVFSVIGSATYVSQYDLVTGASLGKPFLVWAAAAQAITGFYVVPQGSSPVCNVLLQLAGFPVTLVGIQLANLGGNLVASQPYGPTTVLCADMVPFVGDPDSRFILFYALESTLEWTFEVHNPDWTLYGSPTGIESQGGTSTMCTVAATYGSGVGFLYTYKPLVGNSILRFSSYSGDGNFTQVDAPYSLATSSQHIYLTGLVYSLATSTFQGGMWQLQQPNGSNGINAPQWLPLSITPGSPQSVMTNPSMTSFLGMFPVGRPFVLPDVLSAVFQPCVTQFQVVSSSATLGSALQTSEQCTLYLLNLSTGKPVSTVAPRQVDPIGTAFQWWQFPNASLPQSSYDSLRFGLGLNTEAEDLPALGYSIDPSWVIDWFFDGPSQSLLFDAQEIAGDVHIQASVPMIGDGQTTAEDSFFYYPEFSTAFIPQTEPSPVPTVPYWNNPTGTYTYAVVYTYVDGTGQLARSSPVFTDQNVNGVPQAFSVEPVSTTTNTTNSLPQTSIALTSAAGLPNSGGLWIVTSVGPQWVTYTGISSNTLTGCSGGSGIMSVGGIAATNPPTIAFPPYQTTYKSSVNAEIYRPVSGGSTFYLVDTVSAQYQERPNAFGVASIVPTSPGTYTSPPSVVITAVGSGSGATATATISGGAITSVTINSPGTYTSTPTIVFTGGGAGATATVTVGPLPGSLSSGITAVTVTNGGQGYEPGTVAVLSGGGVGIPASLTPVVSNLGVSNIHVVNAGSGYTVPPTISFTGGSGSGAAATAFLDIPPSTSNNIVYSDTVSDADLDTSTILYTTGGILDCVNPPSAQAQCIHWGRKWIVGDDGVTVWFTKLAVQGEVPGFNEALTLYYPDGGPITALASMDDKLVIFKAGSIAVVYGQGPSDSDQGSDLTEPQPIVTDNGALDWRSVCLFPGGLFFRGQTGIYVLDRSLGVTYVGQNVVDDLAAFPVVLSSTLVPSANHVRVSCQNAQTLDTIVLVYDYLYSQWTTYTYQHQSAPISDTSFVVTEYLQSGATSPVRAGFYMSLTADGSLWREIDKTVEPSGNYWYDQNRSRTDFFVPTSLATAWVKIQGVQGYQKLRRILALFEMPDNAGVSMGLAVNYNSTVVQTAAWSNTVIWSLPIPQVSMHAAGAYNKQMACQITLVDTPGTKGESDPGPSVTGEGAVWITLALELQSIGGRFPQTPVAGRA